MTRRHWIAAALAALAFAASAADPRLVDDVSRTDAGRIKRSYAQRAAFRAEWPCPSTGRREGACPGWAVDHVIPLACGGIDAPVNMQWLPRDAKRLKDSFERRVYGGQGASPGCM